MGGAFSFALGGRGPGLPGAAAPGLFAGPGRAAARARFPHPGGASQERRCARLNGVLL